MSILDSDGQPNPAFCRQQNIAKAANTLLGFCKGIVADERLNKQELLALTVWLAENEPLRGDPDALDLLDLAQDILDDGIVTRDELEDMQALIETVLEYRQTPHTTSLKDRFNELLGIAHGLTADEAINDAEAQFLHSWIGRHQDIQTEFPGNVIHERIKSIAHARNLSSEDRQHLIETLSALIGGSLQDTGGYGLSTTLPIDQPARIHIEHHSFCLTGKFVFGPRRRCEEAIIERGGLPVDVITYSTRYLVIGTLASRDWAHGSWGRKVERAVKLRDQGVPISIISEESLVASL